MTGGRVGPLEGHLREAIALNRERAPRYAALSGGASRRISWALIASERLLLPVARRFDRAAAPYHRAGIPMLEAIFVPMSGAPAFLPSRPPAPDTSGRPPLRATTIGRRVGAAYRAGSFTGAAEALERELAALTAAGQEHWMVRHLLESACRLAQLAPSQVALAAERGLPSPAPLLARLLRLHLWGLGGAGMLDRWARPLQARGIAILAQDLPPIPLLGAEPR